MLFGTDGVRGVINSEINSKIAYNIGKGLAIYIIKNNLYKKVVIGQDTRLSSDCYVTSLATALLEFGIDIDLVGVVPTPAISFIVNRLKYSAGIMVTASHNDKNYNGIKVFNQYGEKISKEIENNLETNIQLDYKKDPIGKLEYKEYLVDRYSKYLFKNYINKVNQNIRVVVDAANGSNYKIAPKVLRDIGIEVIEKDCSNNGEIINQNCGANNVNNLIEWVKNYKADFGIAFDGDGDRLRVVCCDGKELNGDDLLYIFSKYIKETSNIRLDYICGTIMTNRGLDKSLIGDNIQVLRSDVGDKNLIELMKKNSIILGGESSGHICFLYYIPTCDALYNALFFLKCYSYFQSKIYKLIEEKITYNSVIKSINVNAEFRKNFDKNIALKNKIKTIENSELNCRIIVRPSGTEPVIRIYVEGETNTNNHEILLKIIDIIKSEQI